LPTPLQPCRCPADALPHLARYPCRLYRAPSLSLSQGFEGLAFPSLSSLPIRLGLRGLAWGAGIRNCADPAKLRVSTYCETGPASGIFTGDMRHDRYESFLRVSVPCGLRFAFPCDSRGKVNEAALTLEAWDNWQWVLNHGHDRPVFATLHSFTAYKAD
jgi:hypothetical protein